MKRMIMLLLLVMLAVGCGSDPVSASSGPAVDQTKLTCTYTFRTNVIADSAQPVLTKPVRRFFGGDLADGWTLVSYLERFYPDYPVVEERKVRGLLTEADIEQYVGTRYRRTATDEAAIARFLGMDSLSQIAMIEGCYAKYQASIEESEELSRMLGGYETNPERDRSELVRIFTEKDSEVVGMALSDISECTDSEYVTSMP